LATALLEAAAVWGVLVTAITQGLSLCGSGGVSGSGWNDMEYPLWPLLHDGGRRPHLAHANVNNAATATDRSTTFSPCLVVSVDGQRIRIETRD
jgi:hypothetical protein